ncbi:MAG: hypothetical protein II917_10585 [Synergistaceae bacterium]|nr:hypothetical protein [Synergistaceae bacterium]
MRETEITSNTATKTIKTATLQRATQSNVEDITVSTGAVQDGQGDVIMGHPYHNICDEVMKDVVTLPAPAFMIYSVNNTRGQIKKNRAGALTNLYPQTRIVYNYPKTKNK